ncbi:MAG: DUF1501 domain-containing protein [Verrucomicrobiales bacterium]
MNPPIKNHEKERLRGRRDFLRQTSCAALGVTGLVNALAHLRLMTAAMAQGAPGGGYKALVFLFKNGGNDSNNMIAPSAAPGDSPARADYEAGRGVLALPSASLHPLNIPTTCRAFNQYYAGQIQPLGFHPSAEALASLFNQNKLAVVANVGTLAFPVPSRAAYSSGQITLPSQLFSHSDQQMQWQSSLPDRPFTSGWGGRAADLLHGSYNSPSASKVSMSISLAGVNSFQIGTGGDVVQYVVQPSGTVNLAGYGTNYVNALNPDGSYKTTDTGKRFKAFEDVMRLTHDNLHEEEYNRILRRARATEGIIGSALEVTAIPATSSTLDTTLDTHFAQAKHSLGDQLKMVARLIAGRSLLGNQRQIFFVQVGGYDTHQNMLASHANLMSELSTGMKAFHDALNSPEVNAWNEVVTFTASDFNRTFTPNNTDPSKAGSDHAWGGHALVMGGAVQGGNLYGQFPILKTGNATGSIDAGNSGRGRWIPGTSVDQYCAHMARWLGVGSNELAAIFPNLPRFDDPFTSSTANLNFL